MKGVGFRQRRTLSCARRCWGLINQPPAARIRSFGLNCQLAIGPGDWDATKPAGPVHAVAAKHRQHLLDEGDTALDDRRGVLAVRGDAWA